ncbi:MAG: helix-turn-helix transcriptional regulator [Phenylobacterium sp.]|uniref:helix-turn-helix domain-containing protein n=1 Tax=Phenylobacterium sp. TaxID=1871053 RepID=UPI002737235B|nr:helix-turn-helix transcriptional regulator [Phenylobacterium sp.]MDP3749291.1 helix-turn-helix transcriptional regulator [Phenylobacterium sp.]
MGRFQAARAASRARGVRLTPRQLECLALVRAGKASAEIGLILGLSSRSVDTYIASACLRLGVSKRSQAVLVAVRLGLL